MNYKQENELNDMAYRKNIKKLWVLPLLLLVLSMPGCLFDSTGDFDSQLGGDQQAGGEILITINIPGHEIPVTRSIAGKNGEAVVKNVSIVVFEDGGQGYPELLAEFAMGEIVHQSAEDKEGYKVQFKTKLTVNTEATTLAIITNVSPEYVDRISEVGMTKPEFLELLQYTSLGSWNVNPDSYSPIPMYGEKILDDKGVSFGMKITDIPLTRMLARIDVENNDENFELLSVYLLNYNQSGYIAPAWKADDGVLLDPQYKADPMILGEAQVGKDNALEYKYDVSGLFGKIYTFEALKTSGNEGAESHTNAICLVIKGRRKGDTKDNFYRIDFTEGKDANENLPCSSEFNPATVDYMPVYRNHLYHFEISEVNGPGYENLEDAYKSLGIMNNLKTFLHVVDINDITDIVFNGEHFLGIGDFENFNWPGGNAIVSVSTNYAYGWSYKKVDCLGSEDCWLEAAKEGDVNAKNGILHLSAEENYSIKKREAIVYLTAGRLEYQLKVTQYGYSSTLEVTGPLDFNYMGGTHEFTVKSESKVTLSDGKTEIYPVSWYTEFSEDNGKTWKTKAPDWLTEFPLSGDGETEKQIATAVGFDQSNTVDLDDALKAVPYRGTDQSPYDLSTKGGKTLMNTANCYIINGPGHYKLPLVYGNAIKNGSDNKSAYTSITDYDNCLLKFVRHDDKTITGPYLYNQSTQLDVVPHDAVLIWMDAPGLINNIRLTDDKTYLGLEIPASTIAQGNAIVAVRNSAKTILWSWHIWVTPLVDAENPVTDRYVNKENTTYNMMQYNLGWCGKGNATLYGSAPRSVMVRITQIGVSEPLSEIFTVTQKNGYIASSKGNNPFWQWGRKDPMLGSEGNKGINETKNHYTDGYNFITRKDASSIGYSIKNPNIFIYGSSSSKSANNWCTQDYFNLWSMDNPTIVPSSTNESITKTVYDPSPVGFTIPSWKVWDHFTLDGMWEYGRYFYTVYGSTEDQTYFPASGMRSHEDNGNIISVGTAGYYWAAFPIRNTTTSYGAMNLAFSQNRKYDDKYVRTCGFSIRCATEKE